MVTKKTMKYSGFVTYLDRLNIVYIVVILFFFFIPEADGISVRLIWASALLLTCSMVLKNHRILNLCLFDPAMG